jgi:4-amino-4-deoxy-L-arabinose transferase-like glycosyltransferase
MGPTPAVRDQQALGGGWGAAVAIATLVLAFNLALAPWTTLWDRDEPRFAQAAVEMEQSGNLLYPTFNGELRPDKPILIYWLMASSVRVLGPTELAVRCWSALGAALACLFTFAIGRRLFSARVGLMAMLILASSPLIAVEAMAATTDAVLLAAITAAMAAFVALLEGAGRQRALAMLAMAAALALAQLTKGPPGLAIPLLVMAGTMGLARRAKENPPGIGPLIVVAAVISLLVFAAWAVPADRATGGDLAAAGFGHHVLHRMVTPLEGHGGHFLFYLPFYLPVVLIGFLPWIVHLPGSVCALVSGEFGNRNSRALLASWIALPIVVFSLVATKLPHYVLPIWPALALAVAATLDSARRGRVGGRTMTWLGRGTWLYGPIAGLAIIGAVAVVVSAPVAGLLGPALVLVGFLTAVTVFAAREQLRGRPWASTVVLVTAMITTQAMVGLWLGPKVEVLKPVPDLAAAIRQTTPLDTPVATFAFAEPSLIFYLGRSRVDHLPSREALVGWAQEGNPGVLVIPRQELEEMVTRHGELPLAEITASSGFNISNGDRVELVALARRTRDAR